MATNQAYAIDDLGEPRAARLSHGHALPAGTYLRDYEIKRLIGEGGFGIVYLAWDHSLQRKVAIKEYLRASTMRIASAMPDVVRSGRQLDIYNSGLKSLVNEARLLARFDHASLVKVYRVWEENGAGLRGHALLRRTDAPGGACRARALPSEVELRSWLKPLLNAVGLLHDGHLWHQNVSPGGIALTSLDPVLFGFGAAEHTLAALKIPAWRKAPNSLA